jgi:hypothetical protein
LAGFASFPPLQGSPAFFLPLFTEVRGRGVLRSSHVPKFGANFAAGDVIVYAAR